MSSFRFYISVLKTNGEYSDFEDISESVLFNSMGNIKQELARNEYDIGLLKFNNISVTLNNSDSKFSVANNPVSVFQVKRDESLFKVTWNRNDKPNSCGSFPCGYSFLSEETEIYRGLLEDNSTKFSVEKQTITFSILSLESITSKVEVPFTALDVLDDANNTLYKILNQGNIFKFFTVDIANINVDNNLIFDDISSLEDKTVQEAVNEILLLTNSVLYVKNLEMFIKPRTESPTVEANFYGPSSLGGIENIHNIKSETEGINRTFNFIKWDDSTEKQSFSDSIDRFGVRKKVLKSLLVTDTGKRLTIISKIITEFGFPKRELELDVPLSSVNVKLFFLAQISIDYPATFLPTDTEELAQYGTAVYGVDKYPVGYSSIFISPTTKWKILNIIINIKTEKLSFRIREV